MVDYPYTPASAPAAKAPKPADQKTRLADFLATLQFQYKHSGPVTAAHIKELQEIVAGKPVVEQHPFPSYTISGDKPGKVAVVYTAEEALVVIRALPDASRATPLWVAAEKAVLAYIDTNEGGLAAQNAFEVAVAADRLTDVADVPVIERLPDGRVREDRFPDRKLVADKAVVAPATPSTPPLVAPVHP
jgi:hypothetical protein